MIGVESQVTCTILQFGDAHPWFLASLAAIVTLLTTAHKIWTWACRMIHRRLETWEDNLVAGYLTQQTNPGPFEPDSRGITPRRQRDCSSIDIAEALRIKPVKVRACLDRLQSQQRVKRRGNSDLWSATDYQMRQPIGIFVRMRLRQIEKRKLAACGN